MQRGLQRSLRYGVGKKFGSSLVCKPVVTVGDERLSPIQMCEYPAEDGEVLLMEHLCSVFKLLEEYISPGIQAWH
jgi:hypothetical protein